MPVPNSYLDSIIETALPDPRNVLSTLVDEGLLVGKVVEDEVLSRIRRSINQSAIANARYNQLDRSRREQDASYLSVPDGGGILVNLTTSQYVAKRLDQWFNLKAKRLNGQVDENGEVLPVAWEFLDVDDVLEPGSKPDLRKYLGDRSDDFGFGEIHPWEDGSTLLLHSKNFPIPERPHFLRRQSTD